MPPHGTDNFTRAVPGRLRRLTGRLGLLSMSFAVLPAVMLCAAQTVPTTVPSTNPTTQPTFPHDVWIDHAGGKLMLRSFDAAPYPHASRDAGFRSNAGEFPRDPHYSDSTVGVFVPPGLDPNAEVNFVVHFHGHRNQVANVITRFQLPEQFVQSGVNAILLFPQGPFMSPDSGGGKLELDPDGFKRFIGQVTTYLREQKLISHDRVGDILLSAHSGGYKVTAGILHQGGMNDHIREVILFDASYGSLSWFADFMKQSPDARLISFHTKHLDDENAELQRLLDAQHIAWRRLDEAQLNRETIGQRGVTFISTQLTHNSVPYEKNYFRLVLETAELSGH